VRSPRDLAAVLLLGGLQACGGSHSDPAAASGGSGSGSGGSVGIAAGGAASSAGSSNASGGGVSIGPQASSDKLDVLFVIDNSLSMGGKQQVLANSLPRFVTRLTNPLCVDTDGTPAIQQPARPSDPCIVGTRESKGVADIHFGVITTSLGSHGGDVCNPANGSGHQDDQAQLLPSKRTGIGTPGNSGFLSFYASGDASDDPASLAANLSAMVLAAGEDGCGYEAPLEAMYRFLVDPEPPLSVQNVSQQSVVMGINDTLLAQREAFLRPDSSLAIVIFSDENDCSIIDKSIGWYVASARGPGSSTSSHMPRATSACDSDPNDPCCRSCAAAEGTPPAGCQALSADSVCSQIQAPEPYAVYDVADDMLNLRCFDQKRRFGVDLLQPIERYTNALSEAKVTNRAGALVDNPLFAARGGKGPRSPSLITLSVIVGVPWQDLATEESNSGAPLEYLDSAGLEKNARWSFVLGDPKHNVPPGDPFMIESMAPRMGQNPVTPFTISPATSKNPQENPINGHEKNDVDHTDLQHACIFHLPKPIVCMPEMNGCDCAPDNDGSLSYVMSENSALCQPPGGGLPTTTQYFAKAYPGTRELTLARQMGSRAVSASLCPRTLDDASSPAYGYGPAFDSLLKRIAQTLK